jgi:type I restriction enzyme M protein
MIVQSEKFVEEHQGRVNDISIYGQECNQTNWRLVKMNLAIRGIDSSQLNKLPILTTNGATQTAIMKT